MEVTAKTDSEVVRQILEVLAELLGASPVAVSAPKRLGRDELVAARVGHSTFIIEWAGSGRTAQISLAASRLRTAADTTAGAIPLVAVPYMGEMGRRLCNEGGIAWLDLSGNAQIIAEGLRVVISGCPNRFKPRGRPASAFAPKSSRIARWLLMHADRPATQTRIAEATGMDRGFTSRTVARIVEDGLVLREQDGVLRVPDPDLLLDAWHETYDFNRHRIIRGHVAARSGGVLLGDLAAKLRDREVDHAATGLAAAWVLTRFAAFRITTLYLAIEPSKALLSGLGFREEPRGANVWLVVHPIQVYLDLKGHPERAEEAAAQLRQRHLSWPTDA